MKSFVPTEVRFDSVLVDKKHFDIGMALMDQDSATMNDEFLGIKKLFVRIIIVADKDYIYGIRGVYKNEKGR